MSVKLTILSIAIAGTLAGAAAAATAPNEARWQFAQMFGQRCQTGQGWCFMGAPALVNSPCFCPTPFGPMQGFVVQ